MGSIALLLVNSLASRANSELAGGLDILEQAGVSVRIERPDDPEAIPEHIRAASGVDRILLAGGDGTLHRSLAALVERDLPLGVLPLGTANDLARSLGIPLDVEGACQTIADGRLRRIDLGRVGDRLFVNVASFGISAKVSAGLDRERKRRWEVLAYALQVLEAVREARPFRLVVRLEGAREESLHALQAGVANGRHYGGGMTADAEGQFDDGLLSVFAIEARGLWALA